MMLRPGACRSGTCGFCSTLKNPSGLERSAMTCAPLTCRAWLRPL